MNDQQVKDYNVFEPDYETKQKWLTTRKVGHHSTFMHLPGFYQDSTSRTDKILFNIGLIVELSTSISILIGGAMKHETSNKLGSIGTVFFLLLLDGMGAYMVHKMKGKYCELDNKIQVEPNNAHAYELQKTGKIYKILGVACIIISGILKCIGVLLYTKISLTILIVLFLIYAFIMYIHIQHTGFYISHLLFKHSFKKQHNKYATDKLNGINSIYSAKIISKPFQSEIDLNFTKIKSGNHFIEFDSIETFNNKTVYNYNLTTIGVMQDSEIHGFLNNLNDIQTSIISSNCLKHQVLSIHTPNKIEHSNNNN
jgi:hypothetical protein